MQYLLFEDHAHFDLLPFTFTRPVWALRSGIYTNQERWSHWLKQAVGGKAYDYLAQSFDSPLSSEESIWINGKLIPDTEFLQLIEQIPPNSYVQSEGGDVLAARFTADLLPADHDGLLYAGMFEELGLKKERSSHNPLAIRHLPDIFLYSETLIGLDFPYAASGISQPIDDPYTRIYGKDNIYVSPGVKIKAAILNAEAGPMYFGPNVEIGEGAIITRSHAFGANTKVSPGAKLRGDSSFGPYCKVGGEIGNSVIMGYSNKGHDGYLGNSVLGYWCNLGADSNTSNLKNNYASVRLWHYPTERFRNTDQQFCGLMMGDHSKCGINTMFNTGTVVGVSANIFGAGYPRNFIPSFSWGGNHGMITYRPAKAFEVAERVMKRRGLTLTESEKELLQEVHTQTAVYRTWEKAAAKD